MPLFLHTCIPPPCCVYLLPSRRSFNLISLEGGIEFFTMGRELWSIRWSSRGWTWPPRRVSWTCRTSSATRGCRSQRPMRDSFWTREWEGVVFPGFFGVFLGFFGGVFGFFWGFFLEGVGFGGNGWSLLVYISGIDDMWTLLFVIKLSCSCVCID